MIKSSKSSKFAQNRGQIEAHGINLDQLSAKIQENPKLFEYAIKFLGSVNFEAFFQHIINAQNQIRRFSQIWRDGVNGLSERFLSRFVSSFESGVQRYSEQFGAIKEAYGKLSGIFG